MMWPFNIKKKRKAQLDKAFRAGMTHVLKRGFKAAKVTNLSAGWGTMNKSADAEIKADLSALRARARDLSINDPYFKKHLNLIQENVIGSQGARLQMKIVKEFKKGGKVIFDEPANRIIEDAWKKWSQKGICTVDGRLSFRQVQKIVIKTVVRDGEIFVRKYKGYRGNDFRFGIELLEADYLDATMNSYHTNGNRVIMGVEVDKLNKPVAYHLWTENPADRRFSKRGETKKIRIPADEIIHVFDPERAAQTRGYPWATASMNFSKMLDGYEEAELVAARVGAAKMGFIVSKDGESYEGDDDGADENGKEVTITDADPGTFEELPEGMSVESWDPQHPTSAFADFVKSILRRIASGLGVGYNTLANDYQNVNYSSLRASNISERDYYKDIQQFVIESFLEQLFPEWLLVSMTSRAVSLPVAKYDKFNKATWRARGWMWVDPLKEVKANAKAVDRNFKSESMIAAEQGLSIEDIYEDRVRERDLKRKLGLEEKTNKPKDENYAEES